MSSAIFHFSDLHFGCTRNRILSGDAIAKALEPIFEEVKGGFFVVTGDITYKGDSAGYSQAKLFFDKIIAMGFDRKKIILCPGNHDICNGGFADFDKFAYSIRRDDSCRIDSNEYKIISDEYEFLALNTAYHRVKEYGLVGRTCIDALSSIPKDTKKRVILMHHPLLGCDQMDCSMIRNSAHLVAGLREGDLVLHGHQHFAGDFMINGARVISARSMSFPSTINHYGFNLVSGAAVSRYMATIEPTSGSSLVFVKG